jgi:hypothetical protein
MQELKYRLPKIELALTGLSALTFAGLFAWYSFRDNVQETPSRLPEVPGENVRDKGLESLSVPKKSKP